jgi:hypothetical protein
MLRLLCSYNLHCRAKPGCLPCLLHVHRRLRQETLEAAAKGVQSKTEADPFSR